MQEIPKNRFDTELLNSLLRAGSSWDGSGWNSTRASQTLYQITRVPLVTTDFQEYLNSFLFAVAIFLQIEVPHIQLSDRASEAAFGLAECFGSMLEDENKPEDPSPTLVNITWDVPLVELAPELAYLWTGVEKGQRHLQLTEVLEDVPRYLQKTTTARTARIRLTASGKGCRGSFCTSAD